MMGKIIFYEDKNFQGRSYETSQDCPDMSSYLSRCHSCRVRVAASWCYDRPNFMGNQYFMKGEKYSDYQRMMGMNDCIRMRIYEKENFGKAQMHEMMDDWGLHPGALPMSDCQSCNVMDGHWLMYEQPHFRGKQMYMRPGEYRNFRDMG
ncbi:hypothetical protein J4Q44_G00148650 [Coregonus suidteri]|uniref:Beta/gamma crystallin 'Greek key' domain-containing protein n=1 Tax=Coregonus suidteri TaxID=861788 RepID=A0AAN8QXC3_9TELE